MYVDQLTIATKTINKSVRNFAYYSTGGPFEASKPKRWYQ
jgi:hypothetical protein